MNETTRTANPAGVHSLSPHLVCADMFWGDRYGQIEDPFGHRWSLATPKRALSEQELRAAAEAFQKDHARTPC